MITWDEFGSLIEKYNIDVKHYKDDIYFYDGKNDWYAYLTKEMSDQSTYTFISKGKCPREAVSTVVDNSLLNIKQEIDCTQEVVIEYKKEDYPWHIYLLPNKNLYNTYKEKQHALYVINQNKFILKENL